MLVWAAPASARPEPLRLQPPSIFDAGLVAPHVPGRILRTRAEVPRHAWGGGYTTAGGEAVVLWVSDFYAEDRAVGQRWADYVGQLVHGPELSRVTVFLGRPDEVEFLCGYGAIACYDAADALIMAPAEDIPGLATAEGALTHEYGHHVSQNRLNTPWDAGEYGTKRWGTEAGVCRAVARHALFPGDQAGHYRLNPSEIYAESYRVLNERKLGRIESPWAIVDDRYYPVDAGLRALELDVVAPWRTNSTVTRRASGPRTFTVATRLDGSLEVRLTGPRYTLALADAAGKVLARSTGGQLRGLVCGQRSLTIRVTGRPRGAFTLTISRP
jgi:hypothetical protein